LAAAVTCLCGEILPHYCPYTATGPGYPGPDPGGPDVAVPVDWLADMGGRDQ